MLRYIARRLALGVLVLFGITTVTFLVARVIPSDPAARWIGPRATAEQIARARHELGLDRPLVIQYVHYLGQLVQGDWGTSIRTHQPVLADLLTYLPASLELILAGTLLAAALGIPVGILAAVHRDGPADHLGRTVAISGVSMPQFWMAMLLQLVFFSGLGWLPLGGRVDRLLELTVEVPRRTGSYLVDGLLAGQGAFAANALWHLVLPALTLAAYPFGLVMRMMRASMLEVLDEEFILVERAYGFPRRRILWRWALKNALGPTLTVLALTMAYSLAGTFLIESVFNWPGLGHYTAMAILAADFPAIVGVTIFGAALYMLLNLLVDVALLVLDPRVRAGDVTAA